MSLYPKASASTVRVDGVSDVAAHYSSLDTSTIASFTGRNSLYRITKCKSKNENDRSDFSGAAKRADRDVGQQFLKWEIGRAHV